MTVLVGGLRALGVSHGGHGIFTDTPGKLTNDFFVTLLDMSVGMEARWLKQLSSNRSRNAKGGADRVTDRFGIRIKLAVTALAEVYASDENAEQSP